MNVELSVWTSLVFAVAALASGCCDQRGCEATSGVVDNAAITQGIAGAASQSSDVCDFCCECPLADFELTIIRADSDVTSNEEAQAIADSNAERLTVQTTDSRYEVELTTGAYMVCVPELISCVAVDVGDDEVRTVHVGAGFNFSPLVPFGRDGSRGGQNFVVRFEQQ